MPNGQPIILGQSNTETGLSGTEVRNNTPGGTAFKVLGGSGGSAGLSARGGRAGHFYGEGQTDQANEGLTAYSVNGNGVHSSGQRNGVAGTSRSADASGVYGSNIAGGYGVAGRTTGDADHAAVFGENLGSGPGVYGVSVSGAGVVGTANNDNGIFGRSANPNASGVYGEHTQGGWGVAGRTNAADRAGVFGDNTGSGPGVYGQSTSGFGVRGSATGGAGVAGESTSGTAVVGTSSQGTGVSGVSDSGTGVYAQASPGATALMVNGRASFTGAGAVRVPAGQTSANIAGLTLTGASVVLATLQQNRPGVFVRAAVPNASAGTVTIHLNQAVNQDTRVAFFVLN